MRVLRFGSSGEDVGNWQSFLLGLGFYSGKIDDDFGALTKDATIAFQRHYGLDDDGSVGNETYGKAMTFGFSVVIDEKEAETTANWPPPPDFKPLSDQGKKDLFGEFKYIPAPTTGNPEGITILGSWVKDNIVKVYIPQLKGVQGAPADCKIFWHKAGKDQIVNLFQAWEDAGLKDLILSWAGSWVPRFVRGSRTTLSNHSYGSAFDINAPWNGLGATPALVGKKGSVRKLVPIANDFGFYWLGHLKTRPDGMHLELAMIK